MPLPKELYPIDCSIIIREHNGTDSLELDQCFFLGFSIYFDRLNFQFQIEKKQTHFTVSKLILYISVHSSVDQKL